MPSRGRPLLNVLACTLLLAILLLALRSLAAWITAEHLGHDSQRRAAILREPGQPLWQWDFRQPADLIAGRAFGQTDVASEQGRLRITSRDGGLFELGFPIQHYLDVKSWSRLRLSYQTLSPLSVAIRLGWQEQQATCLSSETLLAAGPHQQIIDLARLDWQPQALCRASATERTWGVDMLRLQIRMPAGVSLWLDRATLLSAAPWSLPGHVALHLPPEPTARSDTSKLALGPIPRFELDATSSAETMLVWRDRVQKAWPAALISPSFIDPRQAPAKPLPAIYSWLGLLVYAAALLLLHVSRLDARQRARLDVVGCMVGPLWLIAGLHWGERFDWPAMLASVTALLHGMRVRSAILASHDVHASARSYGLALIPCLVTLLLLLSLGHALQRPHIAHVFLYLLWAGLQQWLMLKVVLTRLCDGWPNAPVWILCVITATLFALLHTPNGALMQICLLVECWWARCWLKSGQLLPIVLAHALCGLLVEAGLFGTLLRSLEVSARFFQ